MASSILCSVIVEELAADNCTIKRNFSFRNSRVSAVKDDIGQLLIRLTPLDESASKKMVYKSLGYPIVQMELYKKFLKQGKATICLPRSFVRIMFSNCAPDKLRFFLGTVRTKIKIMDAQQNKKRKCPLDVPSTSLSLLEEISPLRLPNMVAKNSSNKENAFDCDLSIIPINFEHNGLSSPTSNPKEHHMKVSTPVRRRKVLNNADSNRLRSFSHVCDGWNSEGFGDNSEARLKPKLVIDLVKSGFNVFCTGGAGTGKSHLIKRIIGLLPPNSTAITASTGSAANLIGGLTLHAFSGLGHLLESNLDTTSSKTLSDSSAELDRWIEQLHDCLTSRLHLVKRWTSVKHLIIDEISMLSAQLFTRLDYVANEVNRLVCESKKKGSVECEYKPFGGIQLIVFGDFFQLPPVQLRSQTNRSNLKFAFQSSSWSKCKFRNVELNYSWRQSDDIQFAKLLNVVREGRCPDWAISLLRNCHHVGDDACGGEKKAVIPTRLCTHRSDSDAWNQTMLNNLPDRVKTFVAQDSGLEKTMKLLDSICPAPKILNLKVGAQVMLVRNLDTCRGLVNGVRGIVERFQPDSGLPEVRFCSKPNPLLHVVQTERWIVGDSNQYSALVSTGTTTRRQLPLSLAWAISIHKSQGVTLESAELALSKVFECGQAYVALSRCRNLKALRLLDWRPEVIRADPAVINFYAQLRKDSGEQ